MSEEKIDFKLQMEWAIDDKLRLASALREIYSLRGEDEVIAKIVKDALQEANV